MTEEELIALMYGDQQPEGGGWPFGPVGTTGAVLAGAGLAGAAGAGLVRAGQALAARRSGGMSGAASAVLGGALQAGGRAVQRRGAAQRTGQSALQEAAQGFRPPPAQGASDFLTEAGTGLSRVTPEGARIQQNLDTARAAASWDQTPVPHRASIQEARAALEQAGLDPAKATRRGATRHTPGEVLAMAQRVQQDTDEMLTLSNFLARGVDADGNPLSREAAEELSARVDFLTNQINDTAASLGEAGTEAGRQLNIFRLLSRRGEPQDNRAAWLVQAQKVKGAPLTDGELADLNRIIDSGDTTELQYQLSRLRPQSDVQRGVDLFRAVLLTNPPPLTANVSGNALVAGLREVSDVVGYGIDRLVSRVVPNAVGATKSAPSLSRYKAQVEASREAAKEAAHLLGLTRASREQFMQEGGGARAGLRAWMERIRRGAVDEDALRKLDFRQTHFDNPVLDVLAKGAYVGMEATDRIFRAPAFTGSLLDQATTLAAREGLRGQSLRQRAMEIMQSPTADMVTQALVDAERAVFMEQGNVAKVVNRIRRSMGPTGEILMPFTTFASNVAERSITELSPIGTMRGAAKIARIAMGRVPKDQIAEQQRQAVNLLAQSSVASGGPVLLGYMLAQMGLMTGPGMSADRRAYYDAVGARPNAIKVGDTYYGVDRLAPVASLMMMGAAMHEVQESGLEGLDAFLGAAGAAAAVPMELSPVQGIRNMLDVITLSDGSGGVRGSKAGRIVGNVVGSAVAPPVIAATARALDDRQRVAETFGERIQARVPGLRNRLPERIDVLGTNIPSRGGLSAYGITGPVESRTGESPVRAEIARLGVGLRPPARQKDETAAEYTSRAQIYGQQAEMELMSAMMTAEYLLASDEERKEILKRTLASSRQRLTRASSGR